MCYLGLEPCCSGAHNLALDNGGEHSIKKLVHSFGGFSEVNPMLVNNDTINPFIKGIIDEEGRDGHNVS